MPDLTATQWFDRLPGLAPEVEWPADSNWCPRHWAPCPVMGANGIGATIQLMKTWVTELAPHGSYSPRTRNRQLAAAGHICCTLGDGRMRELWQPWLPATAAAGLL